MQIPVKVTQDAVGSLIPSPFGQGMAYVVINNNASPKMATILFFGMTQAIVSFDDFGTRAINYSLANPNASLTDQQSVENIIEHMNENMLG